MNIVVKPYREMKEVYFIELENGNTSLATQSITPGLNVYGENPVKIEDKEYRLWDPYKSKLAAAILKGLSEMPIKLDYKVLYLGAASGTTVSHVSDIIGISGNIYAVEFSHRSMRDLISNVTSRFNVLPILADARFPDDYRFLVENVDVVYCDIAQPEQARILADNADIFLKSGGSILLAIKARSIDSTKKPEEIFKVQVDILKRRQLTVKSIIPLKPYDKDHIMVFANKK